MAKLLYNQVLEFDATLGHQPIRIVTKPGFANWNTITPATELLADTVAVPLHARMLIMGCHHGALGVSIAKQARQGEVWLMDTNFVALNMANQTLQANGVQNAHVYMDVTLLPTYANSFDWVVMEVPKGRKLARRWLVEAYLSLIPGGKLVMAGANAMGIKAVIKDLETLFGAASTPTYRRKHRLAVGIKNAEKQPPKIPWAEETGIAPGSWHEFEVKTPGVSFHIRSLPGVFSYDRLDAGTDLLLSHLSVPQQSRVLDAGCGYGIIGLFARWAGAESVDMIDVDLLAVASARENIICNNITNARAFSSDTLNAVADRQYDLIVTNPPFHAGKDVAYDVAHAFIEQAGSILAPGGQFVLVANKFIRYHEPMLERFGHVECLAENTKYHVLMATKQR